MKDVLGFESSWTYWTLFFLCALVPLPARSDITCASCFAPIRQDEAHAKPTAFISRDFGSAPDGSTDKTGNGDLMELNFPPKRTKSLLSCPGERNCRTRTYPERNGRAQLKKKTEKFIQQGKPK